MSSSMKASPPAGAPTAQTHFQTSTGMAFLRCNMVVVVVTVAAAAMLMTVLGGAKLPTAGESVAAAGAVFPYWSRFWNPALYYGQEVYELAAAAGSVRRSLAPEYDETNSTYYMRLSDVGARYKLLHIPTKEYRHIVTQSDDVVFVNVDSGRALGWRQEGADEFWLVETDSSSGPARLQFAAAEDVQLPCPFIYPPAVCQAYNIVTYGHSSIGLTPSKEDGVTYFKQGPGAGLPFLLLRSTTSLKATTTSVLAAPAY